MAGRRMPAGPSMGLEAEAVTATLTDNRTGSAADGQPRPQEIIAESLALMFEPGQVFEVRALEAFIAQAEGEQ